MTEAAFPNNETDRLAALDRYGILETAEEAAFNALTHAAATICKAPIALVSLVDANRQWFKSAVGLPPEVRETPREQAFCAHAILTSDIFEVPNALVDSRFHDNPLVTDAPNIRFYAGMPLIDSAGHGLGTLCVIDQVPRQLEPHQRAALKSISDAVLALMEARLLRTELTRMQRRTMDEIEAARETLMHAAWRDHEARNRVQVVTLPSQHFSGDIVAAAYTPSGALRGILADAVGHGLAAAFNVLPVLDSFYSMTEKGISLDMVATEINRKLNRLLPVGNFVALGLVEMREASVQVWNGGLPDILLVDVAGNVRHRFVSRHCAGGILPPEDFDSGLETRPFGIEDEIVMYSDGLSEAHDPSGRLFSEKGIVNALVGVAPGERAGLLRDLVLKHIATSEPHDDISVLVIPHSSVTAQLERGTFEPRDPTRPHCEAKHSGSQVTRIAASR
jgi:serine phosphatase RsbU (regulator of sigma subunit)